MSEIKKFISDVGVTFFSSLMAVLIAFPINVLLGRYLGASDLGLYKMVNTIFSTLILFITFGIPASVIKYLAEFSGDSKKQQEVVSSCVITSLVLGIISFLFTYLTSDLFASFFGMPQLSVLLKMLSFAYPFYILTSMLLSVLNGFREMTKNAWSTIVQSLSLFIITFLLLFTYGIEGAVLAIVISSICTSIFMMLTYRLPRISWVNYFQLTKKMISFGSITLFSNAVNLINYQADVLLIGYFLSSRELGVYSVSVMFAKIIWILPDSIQKITFPLISEFYAKKMDDPIKIVVDRCMKYSSIFLVLSSMFFVFFGKQIITLIFGAEFEQAYMPLNILLVGTVLFGITKSVGSIFASVGKLNLVYRIPLVSAIINVILNLILIPIYGINGAAIATTVSFLVSMVLMFYFMSSLLSINIDYGWYFRLLIQSIVIFCLYFGLSKSINNILLGSVLILMQIISSALVIPTNDKKKVFQLIGI